VLLIHSKVGWLIRWSPKTHLRILSNCWQGLSIELFPIIIATASSFVLNPIILACCFFFPFISNHVSILKRRVYPLFIPIASIKNIVKTTKRKRTIF
jgi:hypothetical protein